MTASRNIARIRSIFQNAVLLPMSDRTRHEYPRKIQAN
jgi:hypothetical protein